VTEQYFQSVATKTVTQFKGIENVTGSSFADTIIGNSAANRIDAGSGRDTIDGGGGADTIIGGREGDKLWGGEGPDTFVFNHFLDSSTFNILSGDVNGAGSYTVGAGEDTINDFLVGSDTIDLSGIDANSTISGNQDFEFVEEFTGHAGEVMLKEFFLQPTANTPGLSWTAVLADIDGDSEADFHVNVITPFSLDPMTVNDLFL